jgi:hypothetical protein
VSFAAKTCPHCGAQLKANRIGIALVIAGLAALIFLAIARTE